MNEARTIEKLEIERRFWAERGVTRGVVTERDLPTVLIANLEWMQGPWSDSDWRDEEEALAAMLHRALPLFGGETLTVFCAATDAERQLQPGGTMGLFRRLLATRRWQADLSVPLWDPDLPMKRFGISGSDRGRATA